MAKNDDLQKHTQRVLAEMGAPDKPLSARAAGEKLDIGYNQISDMVKGRSPGEKTLIKFASAVGESPAEWLRYAGKHAFAETLDGSEAPESDPVKRAASQIARELFQVSKDKQPLLLKQIRALIRATHSDPEPDK